MTRRDTIIELARTLRDVQPAAMRGSSNRGTAESFSHAHSTLYRAGSYAQLEAALITMRQPANFLGEYMHQGQPLAHLHHHFAMRYLQADHRPVRVRLAGRNLQVIVDGRWCSHQPGVSCWQAIGGVYKDGQGLSWVRAELWDKRVRWDRVNLALDWLEQELPARLWLPDWQKLSERAAA